MGADVALLRISKKGSGPKRKRKEYIDVVLDISEMFSTACKQSNQPMLDRVDPYGTLVLTTADMPQFITELKALKEGADGPLADLIEDVISLAKKCELNSDMEISIDGD